MKLFSFERYRPRSIARKDIRIANSNCNLIIALVASVAPSIDAILKFAITLMQVAHPAIATPHARNFSAAFIMPAVAASIARTQVHQGKRSLKGIKKR